ncbi:MAG: SidA/IucD/PvdA family monooxygenase [Pseudomonadota bacterium]
MPSTISAVYDVIGIGIGPSNLSVAALLDGVPEISSTFFERTDAFAWHPGLMFRGARLQTSFLKDLVTFADPVNPHSFVNFLHSKQRLHQFINADFDRVTRAEFSEYMAWVSARLPTLKFSHDVKDVRYHNEMFVSRIEPNVEVYSRHIILGVGRRPYIPACARPHIGKAIFHSGEFLSRVPQRRVESVTIIGGGQSAAEVFLHVIRSNELSVRTLNWVTKRDNFSPLDESPFTNEYFTPLYSNYFFCLDLDQRLDLLKAQKLASDGISAATLREIYQEIYQAKYIENRPLDLNLFVDNELVAIDSAGPQWSATIAEVTSGERNVLRSDLVVLATGYEAGPPPAIEGIKHLFEIERDQLRLKRDFSACWRVPCRNRLYLQNAGRRSHGVADPNLSLLAWRGATIINSLLGRERFRVPQSGSIVQRSAPRLVHQPWEQIA